MKSTNFLIIAILILMGISGVSSCNNDTEDNVNDIKSACDQEVVFYSIDLRTTEQWTVLEIL